MKLTVLRHPQTVANEKGIIYGHNDYPYTEKGIRQSEWALDNARLYSFERVVTSPSKRASLLAEKIGITHGVCVHEDNALMEMGFGIFEGMTIKEAEERHPEAYEDFLNEFEKTTIPGGESYGTFSQRTREALERLLREEKDTLVVTHGGVMMEMISRLLELEAGACWNYHIGNCGFMEFKIDDGKARLMNLVNCDHI